VANEIGGGAGGGDEKEGTIGGEKTVSVVQVSYERMGGRGNLDNQKGLKKTSTCPGERGAAPV